MGVDRGTAGGIGDHIHFVARLGAISAGNVRQTSVHRAEITSFTAGRFHRRDEGIVFPEFIEVRSIGLTSGCTANNSGQI